MRIDYNKAAPAGIKALGGVYGYLTQCGLSAQLIELVYLRISQINGCAYCLDMHTRSLRKMGVKIEKLALLQVWHEAEALFDAEERAALAWTEALTTLPNGVCDEVYAEAAAEFSEKELTYLTSAIASINVWNRFGAAYRWTPPPRRQRVAAATS